MLPNYLTGVRAYLLLSLLVFALTTQSSQVTQVQAQPEVVMSGLDYPVALAFAPDGRIFFNEKDTGSVRIIQNGLLLSGRPWASRLGADVISLEPDPSNFARLVRNIRLNKCSRIHALNIAAGSNQETRTLYLDPRNPIFSLVGKGAPRGFVRVAPLDEAVQPVISDSKVGLTNIDVEAAELEVLSGAAETLSRTSYVMIEIWPHTAKQVLAC